MSRPYRLRWRQGTIAAAGVLAALLAASTGVAEPPKLTPEQQVQLRAAAKLGTDADSLRSNGKLNDAVAAVEKRLAIVREVFGKDALLTAVPLEQLARIQQEREDFDASRRAWQEA